MMESKHIENRGFTLVEALIAITILLLVIIGPMTAAQKGAQNAYFASEQLTAVFLAQEAVEAVREIRDTKALDVYDEVKNGRAGDTGNWADTLVGSCSSVLGCEYNQSNGLFSQCSDESGCKLWFNNDTKTYTAYTSGSEISPYSRKVRVERPDPSVGAWKVTSDVSWNNERVFGGTTQHALLETWIYDQYQRYE